MMGTWDPPASHTKAGHGVRGEQEWGMVWCCCHGQFWKLRAVESYSQPLDFFPGRDMLQTTKQW